MRLPRPKRSTMITWVVVVLLAAAGTVAYALVKLDVFAPSLGEQLASVRGTRGAWWLGETFGGLPVTRAATSSGDRVDDLGYGACVRFGGRLDPFSSTRCGFPLWLQVRRRRYALSADELPKRLDGACVRTTVRGAPVVVGQDGAVLYSGDLAIAALGRPELVGRALATVHPVEGSGTFSRPTVGVAALANCTVDRRAFRPLAARIAALRAEPALPLAWVGEWYAGGRLTTADRTGGTAVLGYASCGQHSDLGSCADTLTLSSERLDRPAVAATLSRATCRTFRVGAAPGVAWTKDLAGQTGGGVIVFTGAATISLANDITLDKIPITRLEKVARLVRPLPPASDLPAPRYDVAALLRRCAERTTIPAS